MFKKNCRMFREKEYGGGYFLVLHILSPTIYITETPLTYALSLQEQIN